MYSVISIQHMLYYRLSKFIGKSRLLDAVKWSDSRNVGRILCIISSRLTKLILGKQHKTLLDNNNNNNGNLYSAYPCKHAPGR